MPSWLSVLRRDRAIWADFVWQVTIEIDTKLPKKENQENKKKEKDKADEGEGEGEPQRQTYEFTMPAELLQ